MQSKDEFYIGRQFDLDSGETLDSGVHYDPDDLTTHGVVVGMTGSGKTGLCVDILEEAALAGIPALLIDPKGDITNLLLHFPNLEPSDFEPWVDPDEARREGIGVDELARRTAGTWTEGLEQWGIAKERIRQVAESVQYSVFSPGSTSGIPVSILASLQAPQVDWEDNLESLTEKIATTVTAILGLVGIEADPVKSKEHILLSNIFASQWSQHQDLDLVGLVRLTQDPPFAKLGAFELDEFFPKQDRADLATTLNSLIASPSFQTWTQGQPLDIDQLLWTSDRRPRHSVMYLAHLSDAERMFFVTLLLSAVEAYMRAQPGSSTLRAILYFDELFGYMPPVANPPSKEPMLRLLKQARAFGLGLLLVTQNPVDLDYKGLGNAGTWFIGKLQAERDKARLLDGLEGAREGLERSDLDRIVSAIKKRVFLLHNVHSEGPSLFKTRWAMAYLRGPITRTRLSELNQLVGADRVTDHEVQPATSGAAVAERAVGRPAVPKTLNEYFIMNNQTAAEAMAELAGTSYTTKGLIYRPLLVAQATTRFLDRAIGLDHEMQVAAIAPGADRVRWEDHLSESISKQQLGGEPGTEVSYGELDPSLNDLARVKGLEQDFVDFVYHRAELELFWNPELKLTAQPGESEEHFRKAVAEAAQAARDLEAKEKKKKYDKKIDSLKGKLSKEERELAEDQAELSARKMEEMATHAENIIGLFGGSGSRRRVSTSLTKRRLTAQAKADVEESVEAIEQFKRELEQLEDELAQELDDLDDQYLEIASKIERRVMTPQKKDIYIDLFGVGWFPYWQLEQDGQMQDFPGFKTE